MHKITSKESTFAGSFTSNHRRHVAGSQRNACPPQGVVARSGRVHEQQSVNILTNTSRKGRGVGMTHMVKSEAVIAFINVDSERVSILKNGSRHGYLGNGVFKRES